MGLPAPIRIYAESLVHPSARHDVLTAARHRAFIAPRADEAGVTVEKAPTGELPDMTGDKCALNQILLNLLSNVIRFTDRDGKVSVGARADARAITFVVEENGVGIDEEDLTRPYFQARSPLQRRHGGTGLAVQTTHRMRDRDDASTAQLDTGVKKSA